MNTDQTDSIPVSDAGDRVRMRRERLGATQEELAEQAGVNRDTVSAVEHGKSSAKSRRLVTDALALMEEEAGVSTLGDEPLVRRDVPPAEAAGEPLRFTFHDVFGIGELIVEGPVDRPDELVAAVAKLLAEIRDKGQ